VISDLSDGNVTASRVVAILVVLSYIGTSFVWSGARLASSLLVFSLLPLFCIWFPEAMGSYTGSAFSRIPITQETPAGFVVFGGWLLLLTPVIAIVVVWLVG